MPLLLCSLRFSVLEENVRRAVDPESVELVENVRAGRERAARRIRIASDDIRWQPNLVCQDEKRRGSLNGRRVS